MMEIIELLPPAYRQAVGTVFIPHDDGLALAEVIQSGYTIHAWSDGTVKNGKGAHAYTIRTLHDDPQECPQGSSMTPEDPKSMCSLRTEHFRTFGIALVVQICIRHYVTSTKGYINFFIDNDTVIKRLRQGVMPEMGSTKHCKTDYDI